MVFLIFLISCSKPAENANSCNPFHPSLPDLDTSQREQLIALAYLALVNNQPGSELPSFSMEFDNMHYQVNTQLLENGRIKAVAAAQNNNLGQSVYESVQRALNGNPSLSSEPEEIGIYLTILSDEKIPYPKTDIEWGAMALEMQSGNGKATMLGTQFIEGNLNRERAIAALCTQLQKNENCIKEPGIALYSRPEMLIGAIDSTSKAALLYRGNPISCSPATLKSLSESAQEAHSWLISTLREDGFWPYVYYPSINLIEQDGRNADLRQAMAARTLAELSREDPSLIQLHQKNIDALLGRYYRYHDEIGYMYYWNESKLNTNALMLRALVASPFFDNYQDKAQELADAILMHQKNDGSFTNWYIPTTNVREPFYVSDADWANEHYYLTFSSGEAILALIEYYLKTGQQKYLDAAKMSQEFYLEKYINRIEQNYYPAYVPWHTLSLYNLYLLTNDERYSDAAFILNDKILEIQDTGESYDAKGRFYNPETPQFGTPHVSSDSIYTEGLVYAYRLAILRNQEERASLYKERIMMSAANLIRLQFKDDNMFYVTNPSLVQGALRSSITSNVLRVDNTQHFLDAMLPFIKTEELLESDDADAEAYGYTLTN